jgi:hypothetical protein
LAGATSDTLMVFAATNFETSRGSHQTVLACGGLLGAEKGHGARVRAGEGLAAPPRASLPSAVAAGSAAVGVAAPPVTPPPRQAAVVVVVVPVAMAAAAIWRPA